MRLDVNKPIFLGVCYKYSKEFNIDIQALRLLTIIISFFCSPAFIMYIVLGIVNSSSDQQKSSDDIIINDVRAYEDDE